MNKKQFYTAPEADVLVVRFENVICQSGGELGDPGMPGGDLGDIFDPGLIL